MVTTSAESLLEIINDILDFSKIKAGKLEIDPINFRLRDSIINMMKRLSVRAHQKGLELIYDVPFTVPDHLVGDPSRLRQIMINLLSNAVKFTPEGGRIRVFCTVAERAVSIHVQDTGPGIPADKHAAVFEPFVQLDRGLTRNTEGTGLGLAISRGLARAMDADITLESEVGEGSTFTLSLPLARARPTPRENLVFSRL